MSFSKATTPKGSQATPLLSEPQSFRNFKIAHQRLSLDVDLSRNHVKGMADVILIPLVQNLAYITLDCKNIKVKDVFVENRRCDKYIHDDPLRSYGQRYMQSGKDPLYQFNSVEQSHFLRAKFADLNEHPEERTKSQLIIKIPSSIKITLQDANSLTNYTPITPSLKGTPASQDAVFTPISIKIEYELSNPKTGLRFDTLASQPHLWNAYTTNSELVSTASSWMPCVNMLDEKCTWEIEISVPRKVRDIGTSKLIGQQDSEFRGNKGEHSVPEVDVPDRHDDPQQSGNRTDLHDKQSAEEDGDKRQSVKETQESRHEDDEEDDYDIAEEDETNPLNRDIQVVCSEFSTMKETAHPTDLSKRLYSFQVFNPVAPHHIGWAVGAFDVWTLPPLQSREDALDEETDENYENKKSTQADNNDIIDDIENNDIIPIRIYTLPTQDVDEKTVLNTTIVCQKIMDFYAKEFGSYPFTSYSILFLPTLVTSTMDFASLTLCNTRLLYPPEVIDSMLPTTNELAWSLAVQWAAVNITPLETNDLWCCLGMAGYMVFQFLRKILGNNEFKYRLKCNSEAIVEEDWERPPIGATFTNASRPISRTSRDLEFIKLKAPMVLYILDRRMTKTERSFGMSRILPKIFLQAMSGDLPNNSLSSSHFQYVCERVNKNRLENFFQQWVYGSGVPIFRVTQRFNKKRMMVEMGIRQCQEQELGQGKVLGEEGFCSSALNYLQHPIKNQTPFFTGSMTIRIHEADGTPYEHIVELKDVFTKLDIQYNTKYRRLRNRKLNVGKPSNRATSPDLEDDLELQDEKIDNSAIQRLGNVLSGPKDCKEWNLTDSTVTTDGNEAQRQNEAFEWIRIDSDFEWICKIYVNQPDYMFTSQLQQDSDVEAQVESIKYFEDVVMHSTQNSQIYSSILTRTAMDKRYFYGVRLEACKALAKYTIKDSDPNFTGGAKHLIKIFQKLFCYEESNIPLNNDFTNFQKYFLQRNIPKYLASARNERNESPYFVKQFILDILTYNENSENPYDDTHYLCGLIEAAVGCCINSKNDHEYLSKVLDQLHRYQNLDMWMPTYQLLIRKKLMIEKLRLNSEGLYNFEDLNEILGYTLCEIELPLDLNIPRYREGLEDITLTAFKILLLEGGLKNKEALKYFFMSLCYNPDIYVREKLVDVLASSLDFIATNGLQPKLDDDIDFIAKQINPENLSLEDTNEDTVLITESPELEINERKQQKMKSSIRGLITLLRRQFKDYYPLKIILWNILHVPVISLYQKKRLFDITRIMYSLVDSFNVVLPVPRDKKLVAKCLNGHKVVIKREGLLKVHLPTKIKLHSNPRITINNKIPPATNTVQPPPNKVKISLSKPPAKTKRADIPVRKSKQAKGIVNKIGLLPLRFVKISPANERVDISSAPFSKNVQIIKANSRSFTVKIKLPKKTEKHPQ
ncbi:related to TAF2-Component of TFIID complex [Zygosaccharomyces bailii ISA1307]|nr:related to TAF2-Component of TFIID complex [Zygosaccharomyces bailii ISA1307]